MDSLDAKLGLYVNESVSGVSSVVKEVIFISSNVNVGCGLAFMVGLDGETVKQ